MLFLSWRPGVQDVRTCSHVLAGNSAQGHDFDDRALLFQVLVPVVSIGVMFAKKLTEQDNFMYWLGGDSYNGHGCRW